MNNRLIQLRRGDVAELRDARGATLAVDAGSVWITQHCDARDIALEAGSAWVIERNGKTVVGALRDTRLVLAGYDATHARVHRARADWRRRIRDWFARLTKHAESRPFVPHV